MNKILKDNKYTMIGIVIFIGIVIIVGVCYKLLFSGNGSPLYGNRLDGIKEVEITKDQKNKLVETLKKETIVSSANVNTTGKIYNVHIVVKENTKLADSKKLTKIITDNITKEQKAFYDVQVFFDIEGEEVNDYPTIGYLAKTKNDFKYTSATYDVDEDEE